MLNTSKTTNFSRKLLSVIYVIDTSESMTGERMATLNGLMRESIEQLKSRPADEFDDDRFDIDVKVGVLKFSATAEWVTNGLVELDAFLWNRLETGGVRNIAPMLDALLQAEEFPDSEAADTPHIIFICGGKPADSEAWESKLEWIKNNNRWFIEAKKTAVVLSDDNSDMDFFLKLVGSSRGFIELKELVDLHVRLIMDTVAPGVLYPLEPWTTDRVMDLDTEWDTLEDDNNRVLILQLPTQEMEINDDTIKICMCQLGPCSPEAALQAGFSVGKNKKSGEVELTNLSVENATITLQLDRKRWVKCSNSEEIFCMGVETVRRTDDGIEFRSGRSARLTKKLAVNEALTVMPGDKVSINGNTVLMIKDGWAGKDIQ